MNDASRCIHTLFEEQAMLRPSADALLQNDAAMTYSELNARANRIAHWLRLRGIGEEDVVAVAVRRSFDFVAMLLGILKAGAAYLPLEAGAPAGRLEFMLRDSAPSLIVADAASLPQLTHLGQNAISLEDEEPSIAVQSGDNPLLPLSSDNLAYICYTSGSTGTPKGARIPHRSVLGFHQGVDYIDYGSSQTWLQHSNISWDALTLELWPALLHGARCILARPGALAIDEIASHIQRHGVSALWLTSSLFNLMVDAQPEALRPVRFLLVGGESLSVPHVVKALAALPDTRIVNGYGPSECTVFSCCYPIPADFQVNARSVPIGRPIGDRRVYILNRHLDRVPPGVKGEIFIGGPAVARDYLNCAALTAAAFIPDPHIAGQPGARMYKTGDYARYLPGGMIEFLGREDAQVKVRGFRVELEEIEKAIGRMAGVQACAVLAEPDSAGEKRLVAYVQRNGTAEPTIAGIASHLRASLPDYMIPAEYVFPDRMPLTATGKLDRTALPALDGSRETVSETEWAPPGNPVEEKLAELWRELLGIERVGIYDDFFALGGHSLLAMRLSYRIREVFQVETGLETLFEFPTVAQQAEQIFERQLAQLDEETLEAMLAGTLEEPGSLQAEPGLRKQ